MAEDREQKTKRSASNLRIPPQCVDSERALLGSIMLKPESLYDMADRLSSDSFYSNKHRMVFEVMLELFSKNEPIDLLTLTNRLKEKEILTQVGGSSYLGELVNVVPSASNVSYYADLVQKKFMMRSLIDASEFISELGYNEEVELEEILNSAEKRIYEVTDSPTLHKFTGLNESLGEAWERLEYLHQNKDELRGVKTGFSSLDNILAGFQPSDLVILAARPSMGKTTFALDIARQSAVKHGTKVGVFSLEMSSQQLVDRMLAAEAQVDAWKLRTGRLNKDEEFEKIRQALDRLSGASIYIDDQPANNALKMRSVARRLKSEKGLDLIIIDYLQLMAPTSSRHSDSLVQQVTEISRSLKEMARELNVPVLALSQLNRAVEQRRGKPRLSDLRDSGCLTGDTLITNAKTGETHTIKELAERNEQEVVPVHAVGSDYKMDVYDMKKAFYSGKKRVYKLKTASGKEIKASANHPFLKVGGWERLDKLNVGDGIAVPRKTKMEVKESVLKKEEIILLAHLLGDGCIIPKQPYHYTNAYTENIETVKKASKELFGIEGKIVKQENWYHIYLSSPHRLARGKKHPITNWFEELKIKRVRSYEKEVPRVIFRISDEDIALFLKHIWSTDGNLSIKKLNGRKETAAIYYASSSKKLARSIQSLLLRLGIYSVLRGCVSKKGYREIYQVHVQGALNQLNFLKKVGIADRRSDTIPKLIESLESIEQNPNTDTIPSDVWSKVIEPAKSQVGLSWREFHSNLGISYNGSALLKNSIGRKRMKRIAKVLNSKECEDLAGSGVVWEKIKSIEPLGYEDVYDAEVPDVHNFSANDIIVHNSIEQDADAVMFIYRDDKMNEDSEKPNIAEILIEKHRNGPTGQIELYFDENKTTFLNIEKSDFGAIESEPVSQEDDFF